MALQVAGRSEAHADATRVEASELFPSTSEDALHIAFGVANGLAVIAPLPMGVTLDAVEAAPTQRAFLDFIGADNYLIAYDQRGAGRSAALPPDASVESLGADVWRVADSADVERAVLYGVFDAGASVIEAARQQPDRVLAVVLNFAPPAFGAVDGISDAQIAVWRSTDGAIDPTAVLETLGLSERDVAALSAGPDVHRGIAERLELLHGWSAAALAECTAPVLIIEPRRRALFAGWGDSLRAYQPGARVIHSQRGALALGAIDAFLSSLTDELGRRASYLTVEEARTLSVVEQANRSMRTILVPVEDEFSGVRAVDLACRIAAAQDADIAIVSMVVVPRARELADVSPESAERAERLLRVTTAVAARRGVRYVSSIERTRGFVDGVVQASKRSGADMVVLPNPAHATYRTGNVLEELLARSPCEVLVDRSGRVALP